MDQKLLHFIAACLGMFMFGAAVITLGAILPDVIANFALSEVEAGLLGSLLALGVLFGSLICAFAVDRYGYKGLMVCCTLLMIAGLEGVAFADRFVFLQLSILCIGTGGGAVNVGVNALVSDVWTGNRGAALSILGSFYGIGALGLPLLLGVLSAYFDYGPIIGGVGAAMLIPAVWYMLMKFPGAKQQKGVPFFKGLKLIGKPILFLLGGVLFFEGAIEGIINTWVPLYIERIIPSHPTTEQAVLGLSVLVLALTVVRLLLGKLLKVMPAYLLLIGGIGVTTMGSVVLLGSQVLSSAYISLLLMGAGVGVVFPIILSYIGDLFAGMSGTAMSAVLIMSLVGNILLNYMVGVISESFELGIFPYILLLCLVLQAGIILWARRQLFTGRAG